MDNQKSNNTGNTQDTRTFETAQQIEITRNVVKFGDSVYQFKNITGFKIGKIPKDPFPLMPVIILLAIGLATLLMLVGIILIIIAIIMIVKHNSKKDLYGLIIYLNSGDERIFISNDKEFQMKIVSTLYHFMENQDDQKVLIDMSDKSIKIDGNVSHSSLDTGDTVTNKQ
jgi:hypothetical protein